MRDRVAKEGEGQGCHLVWRPRPLVRFTPPLPLRGGRLGGPWLVRAAGYLKSAEGAAQPLTAITEISNLRPSARAATCTVSRAGNGALKYSL